MPKIEWDIQQNSLDWMRLRSSIPTASCFDQIITPKRGELSEGRKNYACRIIAARLLNWQADSLEKIEHIEAGRRMEPFAVAQLEMLSDIKTRKVGFIRTDDLRFGASPDRVVMTGDAIGITVECKAPTIPTQFRYLLYGHDEQYRPQVQGQLWVAEADKAVFYSDTDRTPPYLVETGRDEPFLAKLADCMERFSDELCALDEKARSLGDYQAFAEYVSPVQAEYGDPVQSALDAQYAWGA